MTEALIVDAVRTPRGKLGHLSALWAGFDTNASGTAVMSHHAETDSWEAGTLLATLGRACGNFELYRDHPISAVGVATDAIAAIPVSTGPRLISTEAPLRWGTRSGRRDGS